MNDRRRGDRYIISLPVRIEWKNETGQKVVEEGLTENVGPYGTLLYLPRQLPPVGGKVLLTVTDDPTDEVTVKAEVIRLERNAAHPQAALNLIESLREWKKKVWQKAGDILAAQKPDDFDDW